ncbi:MAG: hypothetical protein K2J15_04155, partial [Muribaculaceae bacterium]|nr:hypothetical protein [Muribaculaceae bacterium]
SDALAGNVTLNHPVDMRVAPSDSVAIPDVQEVAPVEEVVEEKSVGYYYSEGTPAPASDFVPDPSIWKRTKRFTVGFSTGELDRKRRFGGVIKSRWGIELKIGRNIYLHPKPIAGFMRIGLDLDADVTYLNMAKGSGNLSDMWENPGESEINLGQHYLTAGLAVGPNITFAPFYRFENKNLRVLKFRPYFHVIPSFASYIVSDSDDMEFHSAFAFWCSAGMEIQWKRLLVGLEWKGSTAKYKGLMDSIISEFEGGGENSDSYKFDCNMFNVSIGLAF